MVGSMYFPREFLISKEYGELPLWKQSFTWWFSCVCKRMFYYGPFKITHGAVIAAGLSYNGTKGES